MAKLSIAAVGVALAAFGGVAQAEPTADLLQQICLAGRADKAKALAIADAAGWAPLPNSMIAQLGKEVGVADGDGRITSTVEGMRVLIVGSASGVIAKSSRSAQVCAVAVQNADVNALQAAARRIAAVEPDPAIVEDKQALAFAWRDSGGRRERLTAQQLETSPWDAGMTVLLAGGIPSATIAALIVPIE